MSVMEKRITTIILFFVIGIIGVFSYPQSSDLNENEKHNDSYLQERIGLQEGERIRRKANPQREPHKDEEIEDPNAQDEANEEPDPEQQQEENHRLLVENIEREFEARVADIHNLGVNATVAGQMAIFELTERATVLARYVELQREGMTWIQAEQTAMGESRDRLTILSRTLDLQAQGMSWVQAEQSAMNELAEERALQARIAELVTEGMMPEQAEETARNEHSRRQG